jgi:hypothetical protein
MKRALKVLFLPAIVLFFVAPIVPTPNGHIVPFQTAGVFPRYESLSCALFRVGLAYGPNSFQQNRWTLELSCSVGWP